MAGAFSGQLINSHHTVPRARPHFAPFSNDPAPSQLSVGGGMSWNPAMHGSFHAQPSFSLPNASGSGHDPSFVDLSEATALKIAELQVKLNRKLGPEYVSQRPGPGGGSKLTYAEGWKIINLANEVFGFNGWSSSVVSLTVDFVDEHPETKRVNVGVTAVMRVTLRDGVFHEDIGYGILENSKSKGQALDKCKKEAVTDGIKRALRNFGNLLGNCLYDKEYAKEIVKIRVPPPRFDKDELHRRPEFTDPAQSKSASPVSGPPSATNVAPSASSVNPNPSTTMVKTEPGNSTGQMRPPPTVPPQVRLVPSLSSAGPSAAPTRPVATSTPKGKAPEHTRQGISAPAQPQPRPTAQSTTTTRPILNTTSRMNPSAAPAQAMPAPRPAPAPVLAPLPVSTILDADQETQEDVPLDSADDSFNMYSFTSDDDACLAALDMTGIGGPILHEADETPETSVDTAVGINEHASEPSRPVQPPRPLRRESSNPMARADRLSVIAAAIRGDDAPAVISEVKPALVRKEPQQQRFEPSAGASGSATTVQSVAPLREMNRQSSLQRLNHSSPPPGLTAPAIGGPTTSTPRAPPSMGGGFTFPANFSLLGQKLPQTPPAQVLTLKRDAEAMQGSTSARRPQQGMGLAHQPITGGTAPRRSDPLANAQLGEGGENKRIRR